MFTYIHTYIHTYTQSGYKRPFGVGLKLEGDQEAIVRESESESCLSVCLSVCLSIYLCEGRDRS